MKILRLKRACSAWLTLPLVSQHQPEPRSTLLEVDRDITLTAFWQALVGYRRQLIAAVALNSEELITLQLTQETVDLNLFPGSASEAVARPLVLVVDSYGDNLFLMEELLKLCGCLTAVAADSFTALQMVDRQCPDLILTELVLPEISGIDLVKQWRAMLISAPIVAVTSCLSCQYEEQALQAGCDAFVEKPFSLEQLEGIIARFLIPQPSPVSA